MVYIGGIGLPYLGGVGGGVLSKHCIVHATTISFVPLSLSHDESYVGE